MKKMIITGACALGLLWATDVMGMELATQPGINAKEIRQSVLSARDQSFLEAKGITLETLETMDLELQPGSAGSGTAEIEQLIQIRNKIRAANQLQNDSGSSSSDAGGAMPPPPPPCARS